MKPKTYSIFLAALFFSLSTAWAAPASNPLANLNEAPEFQCTGGQYQLCAACQLGLNTGTESQFTSEQKQNIRDLNSAVMLVLSSDEAARQRADKLNIKTLDPDARKVMKSVLDKAIIAVMAKMKVDQIDALHRMAGFELLGTPGEKSTVKKTFKGHGESDDVNFTVVRHPFISSKPISEGFCPGADEGPIGSGLEGYLTARETEYKADLKNMGSKDRKAARAEHMAQLVLTVGNWSERFNKLEALRDQIRTTESEKASSQAMMAKIPSAAARTLDLGRKLEILNKREAALEAEIVAAKLNIDFPELFVEKSWHGFGNSQSAAYYRPNELFKDVSKYLKKLKTPDVMTPSYAKGVVKTGEALGEIFEQGYTKYLKAARSDLKDICSLDPSKVYGVRPLVKEAAQLVIDTCEASPSPKYCQSMMCSAEGKAPKVCRENLIGGYDAICEHGLSEKEIYLEALKKTAYTSGTVIAAASAVVPAVGWVGRGVVAAGAASRAAQAIRIAAIVESAMSYVEAASLYSGMAGTAAGVVTLVEGTSETFEKAGRYDGARLVADLKKIKDDGSKPNATEIEKARAEAISSIKSTAFNVALAGPATIGFLKSVPDTVSLARAKILLAHVAEGRSAAQTEAELLKLLKNNPGWRNEFDKAQEFLRRSRRDQINELLKDISAQTDPAKRTAERGALREWVKKDARTKGRELSDLDAEQEILAAQNELLNGYSREAFIARQKAASAVQNELTESVQAIDTTLASEAGVKALQEASDHVFVEELYKKAYGSGWEARVEAARRKNLSGAEIEAALKRELGETKWKAALKDAGREREIFEQKLERLRIIEAEGLQSKTAARLELEVQKAVAQGDGEKLRDLTELTLAAKGNAVKERLLVNLLEAEAEAGRILPVNAQKEILRGWTDSAAINLIAEVVEDAKELRSTVKGLSARQALEKSLARRFSPIPAVAAQKLAQFCDDCPALCNRAAGNGGVK